MIISKENILKIQESASKKLERAISKKSGNALAKARSASDWVQSIRWILSGLNGAFEELALTKLSESKDSVMAEIDDAIEQFIIDFSILSVEFVKIYDRRMQPLSMAARQNIDKELNIYWNRLEKEIHSAKQSIIRMRTRACAEGLSRDPDFAETERKMNEISALSVDSIRKRFIDGEDILSF